MNTANVEDARIGIGTAGGAAGAGGASFQQSVAAYALTHVLIGDAALQGLCLPADFQFQSLHMESSSAIDDITIRGKRHRVMIQSKSALSLSDSLTSEYASVIKQFVDHHLHNSNEGDMYVLATSQRASSRITCDLKKLVEATRLNILASIDNPLTKNEAEVLEKTRQLVLYYLKENGVTNPCENDFTQVFQRMYVLALDIETMSGRDVQGALYMLRSKALIGANLLWDTLVRLCSTLAQDRMSIDTKGLIDRLGCYLAVDGRTETLDEEIFLEQILSQDVSVGKEVAIFYFQEKSDKHLIIFESQRFDNDGRKITSFVPDGFRYSDGAVHPILCRTATNERAMLFLEEHPELVDAAASVRASSTVDPESNIENTPWANAHKQLIREVLTGRQNTINCLVCGEPVSEDGALLVEIDEEGANTDAGIAHRRCHYPSLRILGEVKSKIFEEYKFLRDFDFKHWIRVAGKGLSVGLANPYVTGIAKFAWEPFPLTKSKGSYCIRIDTRDGSSHYSRHRGRVARFAEDEADSEAKLILDNFRNADLEGNPFCVTENRQFYAKRSMLLKTLPRGTRLLNCVNATAVKFNLAIDKAYSTNSDYYAPVILLADPGRRGRALEVFGCVVLLTNPLNILAFVENWQDAGYDAQYFSADIIDNDADFDVLVQTSLRDGVRILVDPMYETNGDLMSGIEIVEHAP